MKKNILSLLCALPLIAALNANAQVPSYVPTTGLVAWYPFNSNGNDASNHNNTLGNYGATFVADRFGNPAAAASFNGSSNWFQINAPSFTFAQGGQFTYSVWEKKSTQPLAGIALMNGNNTAGNFISIIQGPTEVQFGCNKQQSAWIWTTCPDTIGAWMHIVVTYNNGVMNLYRDGMLQSSTNFTYTGTTATNMPFYVGRGFGGGYYAGLLDDVGVWNLALSPLQVTALYNSVTTGLDNITKNQEYSVFPIPSKGNVNVKLNNTFVGKQFNIVDQLGKIISTGTIDNETVSVDLSNYAAGVYYFETTDKSIKGLKIVRD
jgi:Concanavalin A-like lectin/glucanases superfamily/Secretion system C-terminal sorting domain